jgi:hypothetical protein
MGVFVTGTSQNASGANEMATLAYSTAGQPLWTNFYAQPAGGYSQSEAVAIATAGDKVYIAGARHDLPRTPLAQTVILAYSVAGQPLWTNYFSAPPSVTEVPKAVAVDENGALFVTGACDAWNSGDYFTLAYLPDGTALWTNRYDGLANAVDCALGVAARAGRVCVTGYAAAPGVQYECDTISYSTSGVPLWTNRYLGGSPPASKGQAIALDASGNVFVTGYGYDGGFTLAYAREGTCLWTNRHPGTGDNIALDASGNVIVAGGSALDLATVAFSAAGAPLWTNYYDGPIHGQEYMDSPGRLAVEPPCSVYVTCASQGIRDGVTNFDFVTLKFTTVPDIQVRPVSPQPGVGFRLTITAPTNTAYRLEASPDLANWRTLTNFAPLPVESVDYTDTQAPGFAQRFYRTVWSP